MKIISPDNDLTTVNKLLKKIGAVAEWDQWNIRVFKPSPEAAYSPKGVFKNGAYGFETLIEPNEDGHWVIN